MVGDMVTCARSTLKPAHTRSNGVVIPEKLVTKLRDAKLLSKNSDGIWLVVWRDAANKRHVESYFAHEITKPGANPLFAADK